MSLDADEVAVDLRSVLESKPSPIPLKELQKDYEMLVGSPIPFRELGFSHLKQYLQSVPDVVKIKIQGNTELVEAVFSPLSAHINQMVKKQKKKRVKSFKDSFHPPRFNNYSKPNVNFKKKVDYVKFREAQNSSPTFDNRPTNRVVRQTENSIAVECVNKSHEVLKRSNLPVKSRVTFSNHDSPMVAPADDHITKLMQFLRLNPMGEVQYTTHFTKSEKKYFGAVKIGAEEVFSTYPASYPTREAATNEAAKCAFDDLQARTQSKQNLQLKTSPNHCVIRRLHELLASYDENKTGVFSTAVPDLYVNKYNELLPALWLQSVADCDNLFSISKVDDKRSIVYAILEDDYVRFRKFSNGSIKSDGEVSRPSPCTTPLSNYSSGSSETSEFSNSPLLSKNLALPEDDKWDVFVSYVENTGNFQVRLIGPQYSEKLEELLKSLNEHYERFRKVSPRRTYSEFAVGSFAAAKHEDYWHRVELVTITDTQVNCLFIDHGDFADFDLQKLLDDQHLFPLEQRFFSLPPQAIKCTLEVLDSIEDVYLNEQFMNEAVGKVFVAAVINREDPITVQLYGSKNYIFNNSLNYSLMKKRLLAISKPKLKNGMNQVYQSHISADGRLFCHLFSLDVGMLEGALETIGPLSRSITAGDVMAKKMCLAKVDFSFQRVFILSVVSASVVNVIHVDYGRQSAINVCDIYNFPEDFDFIQRVPFQAICCSLSGVPPDGYKWSPKASKRLEDIASPDQILIAVLRNNEVKNEVYRVNLFKRLENENNELVSINQTLALDCDLFDSDSASAQPQQPLNDNYYSSNQRISLPNLVLPKVGEFVDIHVTLVANPFNFMFQLWQQGERFDKLVLEMHEFYQVKNEGKAVEGQAISKEELYAFYYLNVWCRVKTKTIVSGGQVAILFVDYGDELVVYTDSLKHLETQFRNLPPQALKARLANVMPLHGDWQAEDCVRFRELTNSKQFVAKIVAKSTRDETLAVELFDTSTSEDIRISDILIQEGRGLLTS